MKVLEARKTNTNVTVYSILNAAYFMKISL